MEIKVNENNVEGALKVLKRKLEREGLFKEVKRRAAFEKPSQKRKRKQLEAKKKRTRSLRFKKTYQRNK